MNNDKKKQINTEEREGSVFMEFYELANVLFIFIELLSKYYES
jgi:hypothetical protein